MQRYGPPPSYPNLKIPGLNAPIPEGATYGFHPAGWGKPPVDEYGRPLYGDVFGTQVQRAKEVEGTIERTPWGEVEEEETSSSEEEEEDEGVTMDDETSESGISSVTSIASMSSLASGLETPDAIDLRKDSSGPKQLFTVLEQKEARVGSGLMGSSHGYVVPGEGGGAAEGEARPKGAGADLLRKESDVQVQLDPKDLESDEAMQAALKKKFDDAQATEAQKRSREDFSDMVSDQAGQLAKKRKAQEKKKADGKQYKNVF